MQPPPRGRGPDAPNPPDRPPTAATEADPIVERIRAWAKKPTVEATIELCEELRHNRDVRGNHVDALAKAINQRHAKEPRVLLLLGRLQLAIGKLGDAQQTLVAAGRADAGAQGPYRYLGEVLLRRGDAARAERMLERSLEMERADPSAYPDHDKSDEWLARARVMKSLQERQGEGAVAAEVAMLLSTATPSGRRLPSRSSLRPPAPVHAESEDQPTQVSAIPDDLKSKLKPGFATRTGGSSDLPAKPSLPKPSAPPKPALGKQPSRPPPLPQTPIPPPPPFAMGAPVLPPPTPPPPPPPPGRAIGDDYESVNTGDIALASTHLSDASDAKTLPRAELYDGSIEMSDHPTLRLNQEFEEDDHASVPRMRAEPPRSDDASPEPAKLPTASQAMRALKADSVTLGGASDAIAERPRGLVARGGAPVIPPSPPRASSSSRPVVDPFAPTHDTRPQRAANDADAPPVGEPWPATRVLDALAKAGVYEPDAAAKSPGMWLSRKELERTRRRGGWMYIVLAIVLGGGVFGFLYGGKVLKEKKIKEADERTLHAETEVRKGGLEALATAEAELAKAFELDSRTRRGALVWLEDRALRSYVWPSEDRKEGGLASAIERAKTVGITEPELAFARITLALSSEDTPSAAALAKTLDPGTAKEKQDAWRELAVGWVLERAGDARAVERYSHATALDLDLVPARLALAKLAALAADGARVESLTSNIPNDLSATRDDLLALATLVKTGLPGKGGAPEQRRPAGFGWIAPALVLADPKAPPELRKKEAHRAFALARDPGDLTRVGRLAAAAGEEAIASRAALRALEVSPIFPPARALAARLALLVGRPDDAGRALEGISAEGEPEIAALRAWLAYERGDYAAIGTLLDDPTIPAGALDRADIAPIAKPLRYAVAAARRPSGNLNAKELAELQALRELGELGPLVAFDLAIAAGDYTTAETIGKAWPDVSARPAHALRLAKLARMQGKADEADRLSKIAVEQGTVVPSALVERVLVLCGIGKGADALALLSRYPLLATDEQPWLRAYATAQAGKVAEAKKIVEGLKEPDKKAPWPVRRDALLALAAAGDTKRAKSLAKELSKERPNDPDVAPVAKALGK